MYNHFIHVCLCVLHCIQNEVLQLLLLCTQASDGSKQLALQWIVSKTGISFFKPCQPRELWERNFFLTTLVYILKQRGGL